MSSIRAIGAPADWPKPGEDMPPQIFGPFSAARMQIYALASGDDNPLHFNSALAAKSGLEAPPVHGVLMLSCCEPAIHAWRQDVMVAKLSAKFLLPVLTGQSIAISGRVLRAAAGEPLQMVLRIMGRIVRDTPPAQSNRDLAILAEATLRYRPQV